MLAQRAPRNGRFLLFKGNPAIARIMRQRQILNQSPQQRKALARKAALARWAGHRSSD
jgi:hypothetical protein